MTPLITLVCPFYRQPQMLRKQLETWAQYSLAVRDAMRFIIVDDCSPEPARDVLKEPSRALAYTSLYRIDVDKPWNRGMARNLGTKMATTPWVLHVDTDHVLTAGNAANLLTTVRSMVGAVPKWFRFSRYRVGAADETRKKDKIPPGAKYGKIHPHIDSYLCMPKAYWAAGGYNEDFSGVLGGGTPFLKEMERVNGEPPVLEGTFLEVHTRDSVSDSSEHTLPRDSAAFKRRKHEIMAAHGTLRGHDPIRLPWHRVL